MAYQPFQIIQRQIMFIFIYYIHDLLTHFVDNIFKHVFLTVKWLQVFLTRIILFTINYFVVHNFIASSNVM